MSVSKITTKINSFSFSALPSAVKGIIYQLLCFGGGFLTAYFGSFSGISPFPIAFACAVTETYSIAAACGAAVGYILSSYIVSSLRYVAILAAIVIIKRTIFAIDIITSSRLTSPIIALLCTIATGIVVLAAQDFSVDGLLIYSGEAIFAAGATFFLENAFRIKHLPRGIALLNKTEIFSLIISICILFLSLSSITVRGISFIRIISVFVILMSARYSKESGGSIVGICLGTAMSASVGSGLVAASWGLGGLLAGVFAPMGKICQSIIFLSVQAVFSVLQGDKNAYLVLFEVLPSVILFAFIKTSFIDRYRKYFTLFEALPVAGDLRDTLTGRLKSVASAIDDVSDSVNRVSRSIEKITAPDMTPVVDGVRDEVCSRCTLRTVCWDNNFEETAEEFANICDILKTEDNPDATYLPKNFKSRCNYSEELMDSFSKNYFAYAMKAENVQKNEEIRDVVASQFKSVSDILNDMVKELNNSGNFNNDCATRIAEVYKKAGIKVYGVSCIEDENSLMRIETHTEPITKRIDLNLLSHNVESICKTKFELPNISYYDNETVMSFIPKNNFTTQIGLYQISSNSSNICGDCAETCITPDGRKLMILSDGMGTGGRAAVDATMAAKLFGRLASSGVSFESALKIINSALIIKSAEESFATLDIVSVDLYTGNAKFYKAGAAITFIKKRGRVISIEPASMPVGILTDTHFAFDELCVEEGDMIVMVSDGAVNGSVKWIYDLIENHKGKAYALAKEIGDTAKHRRRDNHHDDITVMVMKIEGK